MPLSFKKHSKATGLQKVGDPHSTVDIKWNKKIIGNISPPTWSTKDKKWSFSITVLKENILEDGNPNCEWKRVRFSNRFDTDQETRNFIKINIDKIFERYNVYCIDEKIVVRQ